MHAALEFQSCHPRPVLSKDCSTGIATTVPETLCTHKLKTCLIAQYRLPCHMGARRFQGGRTNARAHELRTPTRRRLATSSSLEPLARSPTTALPAIILRNWCSGTRSRPRLPRSLMGWFCMRMHGAGNIHQLRRYTARSNAWQHMLIMASWAHARRQDDLIGRRCFSALVIKHASTRTLLYLSHAIIPKL